MLEIVEYNPCADRDFITARAIHDLCSSVIGCVIGLPSAIHVAVTRRN